MKISRFRVILTTIAMFSLMLVASPANAAPVKYKQVVQVVNVKPGKAKTGSFSQLRLASAGLSFGDGDGDGDEKKEGEKKTSEATTPQDDRVITTTVSEIVQDEDCQCDDVAPEVIGGFPKWPLFGLGAIPLAFIPKKDETPTPTPTTPTIGTMTPTPTPITPTPTPTPMTPTPTPTAPVPEPMTLLLFGSGLAGVGLAARRRFGKKDEDETEE